MSTKNAQQEHFVTIAKYFTFLSYEKMFVLCGKLLIKFLLMKSEIKKKLSVSKKIVRYEKNVREKFVHLKKIYKFTLDHFLFGHVIFVLTVKNVMKNSNLYRIYAMRINV